MTLTDEKAALRKKMRMVRTRLSETVGVAAAAALAAHVTDFIQEKALSGPVSAYWPGTGEMDCRPLLKRLDAAGMTCCLPVVGGKGQSLIFRRWRRGDVLVRDRYGLDNPIEDQPELTPSLVLAPLVAFDAGGNRLGQRGGFYDRTIAALRLKGRPIVIGLAFAGQEVDRVPIDVYDEPLDAVATEQGIRRFKKSRL